MTKAALFVRHRAKPGRREDVQRVWERHVKPRAQANAAHEAYFFCFDDRDPDVISVFQLYCDAESMQSFLSGDWYPEYLKEVSQLTVDAPQIMPASLVWMKGAAKDGAR